MFMDFSKTMFTRCDDCPYDKNSEPPCEYCNVGAYNIEEVDDDDERND